MRKRIAIVAIAALVLVGLPLAPAGATPPLGVDFDVPTVLPPDGGPSFGPFVATGPAVDAGLICETGETVDVFGKASGFQAPTGVNFQIVKLFTCDDGSGAFLVKLQVRINQNGDNFQWTILEGYGAYESLHGSGDGIGVPFPGGVLDLYSGKAHQD